MKEKMIRIYQPLDVKSIKPHTLIYGDLSGQCENCLAMDIKLDQDACPQCQTPFHYIAFRNVKSHLPKIHKLLAERPNTTIIDFEDYKRSLGTSKAEDLFK